MNKLTLIFLAFIYIIIEVPSIAAASLVSFFTNTQMGSDKIYKVSKVAVAATGIGLLVASIEELINYVHKTKS